MSYNKIKLNILDGVVKIKKVVDHLEKEFKSYKEMCDYWGIEYSIFYGRYFVRNWSLKDALTKPIKSAKKKGEVTNNLIILEKYRKDNQTWYKTKCVLCGTIRDIYSSNLKHGCIICNPTTSERIKEKLKKKYEGKVVNNLKILEVGNVILKGTYGIRDVKCQCSCGKIFNTNLNRVLSGNTTSCGHDTQKNLKKGIEISKEFSVDGTNIFAITNRKTNKNNTSGIKGVSKIKSGDKDKYRAYINFKRKQYHLGKYNTLEEAAYARKEAEEKIYGNFLEWYAKEFPEQWEKIKNREKKDEQN